MVPPKDIEPWPPDEELVAWPLEGAEPAELRAYVERFSQRFQPRIACVPVGQRSLERAREETDIVDGGTLDLEELGDGGEPGGSPENEPPEMAAGPFTLGGRTLRLEAGSGQEQAPEDPVAVPLDPAPRRWLAAGLASALVALAVGFGVFLPAENAPPLEGSPAPFPTTTAVASPETTASQAPSAATASAVPPVASAPGVVTSAVPSSPALSPKRDGGVASPPGKPPTPLSTVGPLFDNDDE